MSGDLNQKEDVVVASSTETLWLTVGTLCTVSLAVTLLILTPDRWEIFAAVRLMPQWLMASVAMAGVLVATASLRMMYRGVERPLHRWWRFSIDNRARIYVFVAGVFLTGLNMMGFMWVKSLLNYLIPFSADPMLARVDRALFLVDPWRLLGWLNSPSVAQFYHRGWFALMVLTLVLVLTRPPSKDKTALLCTYFLLWSVFGPLVHALIPAAGPLFFSRLAHGDLFDGLVPPAETQRLADYLWLTYEGSRVGPVSGISAMPSMHIAMVAWMTLAVGAFARRWLVPMALAAVFIFLLSISLGWHYAVDGVVGAAGAVLMLVAVKRLLVSRRRLIARTVSPASIQAANAAATPATPSEA